MSQRKSDLTHPFHPLIPWNSGTSKLLGISFFDSTMSVYSEKDVNEIVFMCVSVSISFASIFLSARLYHIHRHTYQAYLFVACCLAAMSSTSHLFVSIINPIRAARAGYTESLRIFHIIAHTITYRLQVCCNLLSITLYYLYSLLGQFICDFKCWSHSFAIR